MDNNEQTFVEDSSTDDDDSLGITEEVVLSDTITTDETVIEEKT